MQNPLMEFVSESEQRLQPANRLVQVTIWNTKSGSVARLVLTEPWANRFVTKVSQSLEGIKGRFSITVESFK